MARLIDPIPWTTHATKPKQNYDDWKWAYGIMPTSKMKIGLIMSQRGRHIGNLTHEDVAGSLTPTTPESHDALWSGLRLGRLMGKTGWLPEELMPSGIAARR